MDQVKQALVVLRKYHFWILCTLIMLLYVGVWFVSTSTMSQETETRSGKIASAFKKGDDIVGISNHPNTESAKGMQQLNRAEAEQVRLAWEGRFREQEDVLKWPEKLLPDFISAVEPLKPIEAKVDYPTPPNKELKPEFRNRYRDYIREELPKLAEIIGAEWRAGASGSGGSYPGMGSGGGMMPGMGGMGGTGGPGMGGMGPSSGMLGPSTGGPSSGSPGMSLGLPGTGAPGGYPGMGGGSPMGPGAGLGRGGGLPGVAESSIVVDWNSSNQSALQATMMNWTSPTTLQVLYAQEDLWVLRAMMLIIKATNGDADAQYNAAVKEIESLELGAMAAGIKAVGHVKSATAANRGMGDYMSSAAGGGGMLGQMAGAAGGGASGTSGGGDTGGGGSSTSPYGSVPTGAGANSGMLGPQKSVDPAAGRYVDDKNEPLSGDRLRTAIKSDQPSDAFLAVAKRMPMRMRVKMNVLKLPLFLCEFAKSDLPVEVRQVRINAPAGSRGGFAGGLGSSGMSRSGPSSGPSGAGMGMGGGAGATLAAPDAGGGTGMPPSLGGMLGGGTGMPGMGGGALGAGNPYGGAGGGMGSLNTESPYDASVDIYGIIYIYNPVDPAKLGIDMAKEEGAATGTDGATVDAAGSTATGSESAPAAASSAAAPANAPAGVPEAGDSDTNSVPAADGEPTVPSAADAPGDTSTPPAADGTGATSVTPAPSGTDAAASPPAAPASDTPAPPPAASGAAPAASPAASGTSESS